MEIEKIKQLKIIDNKTISLVIETYDTIEFLESVFRLIKDNIDNETLDYFYENFNKLENTTVILEIAKILKDKGYNIKISDIFDKIDTYYLDFEDIFLVYDILKNENMLNAIYKKVNKTFFEQLARELHFIIKHNNEIDILEACNNLTNYLNDYKELITRALKMVLQEDLIYIKNYNEFVYWLEGLNRRESIYTKRFLLFMKFIFDNNLQNEFSNEINEFKTVIKKYENEIEKAIKKKMRNKKETIRKQIEALILLTENKKLFKYLI